MGKKGPTAIPITQKIGMVNKKESVAKQTDKPSHSHYLNIVKERQAKKAADPDVSMSDWRKAIDKYRSAKDKLEGTDTDTDNGSVAKQTIGPFPEKKVDPEVLAEKAIEATLSTGFTKTGKSKWNPASDPLVKELKTTKPGSRKAWKLQSEINEQQGSRKKYTRKEYKEKYGIDRKDKRKARKARKEAKEGID